MLWKLRCCGCQARKAPLSATQTQPYLAKGAAVTNVAPCATVYFGELLQRLELKRCTCLFVRYVHPRTDHRLENNSQSVCLCTSELVSNKIAETSQLVSGWTSNQRTAVEKPLLIAWKQLL